MRQPTDTVNGSTAAEIKFLRNEAYTDALLDALTAARYSIDSWMFAVRLASPRAPRSANRILAALTDRAAAGLKCRIISAGPPAARDDAPMQWRTHALMKLAGWEIYAARPGPTMHAKTIIIDNKIVFVGSHNLTGSALQHNEEHSIMIQSPQLSQRLSVEFKRQIGDLKCA